MADAKNPPHVPRSDDTGHPNPRPPMQPGRGSTPGNPGNSGEGGPVTIGDRVVESSGETD